MSEVITTDIGRLRGWDVAGDDARCPKCIPGRMAELTWRQQQNAFGNGGSAGG